jgi:hypothetical protein
VNNLPPGVTGNEWQIAGADEFEFGCPTSDHDLTFSGDQFEATAECPECGTVTISPVEIWESDAAEAAGDAERDER